jgi:hypothetical protein
MFVKPLIVDWKGLQKMGWPYSRTHTVRLMATEIRRSKGSEAKGTYREWIEPNPDPFPQCRKLGTFRNAHPVWIVSEVLAYFETHGLQVTADWNAL